MRHSLMISMLLALAATMVACVGSGGGGSDSDAGDGPQVGSGAVGVSVECDIPIQGATWPLIPLDAFLKDRPNDEEGGRIIPRCTATAVGGAPRYDFDLTVEGYGSLPIFSCTNATDRNPQPNPCEFQLIFSLPPGEHDLVATARDSSGDVGSSTTTAEWYWDDAERITVAFEQPSPIGAVVDPGQAIDYRVRFEAWRFAPFWAVGSEEDLVRDLGRYLVKLDLSDGASYTEEVDVREGVVDFSHAFTGSGPHWAEVHVTDQLFGMLGQTPRLPIDVTTEPTEPTAPVVTATLLMEAIRAMGAPTSDEELRGGVFEYQEGQLHYVSAGLQLSDDPQDPANPVEATVRVSVYATRANATAAGLIGVAPATDDFPLLERYRSDGPSGFRGYVTAVTSGGEARQFFRRIDEVRAAGLTFRASSNGHTTRVSEIAGSWVVVDVQASGPANPTLAGEGVYGAFTSASGTIAGQVVAALERLLSPA